MIQLNEHRINSRTKRTV